MNIKDKARLLERSKAFTKHFTNLSENREIRSRLPKVGSEICRALAYRLRYRGLGSMNTEAYESISATALIDQRIFEVSQRSHIDPMRLLASISSEIRKAVSEPLKQGLEEALYMLECCITLFELASSGMKFD